MRRWLLGLLVLVMGFLASPTAVPIYDGLGTDDPYRFVGSSPAPSTARTAVKVSATGSEGIELQTVETGPQVLINAAGGLLTSAASTVTLTATPLKGDGALARGTIDGNVYRITASSPVGFSTDAGTGYLYLRAAVMTKPAPVLVHRATATDPWTEIKSSVSGRDNLVTPFKDLGDYAVVRLPGSEPLSSGGLGTTRLVFIGAGVLLLVVVTVLVLRRPRDEEA
jgi:hypothetical protein